MMEDWTDIIGEELENIEEPLPADDWSVLQQKYSVSRRRKKAGVFAWTGSITSVAAAIALLLLLTDPDVPTAIPDMSSTASDISSVIHASIDNPNALTAKSIPPKEDFTENVMSKQTEEVIFDVIRDTTSVNDRLIADAEDADKKKEEHSEPTGTFGFEDFSEDKSKHRRRHITIGISGMTSGSLVRREMDFSYPDSPGQDAVDPPIYDPQPPDEGTDNFPESGVPPTDSAGIATPPAARTMMRSKSTYSDSYDHDLPISIGLSVRFFLTDRLSINTGVNYIRYSSVRKRYFHNTHDTCKDRQYVHYLGIPVRLDWMAVNRKHFNFYLGAGIQMDKCIYATVGTERLYENKMLFGVNGTMGVQVNILPQIGIYLEPEVSYSLNEGTIETFRSSKPFLISACAGLRFSF